MPAQIVVLGATNRIHEIDEAILRRMPKKFPVPLPDQRQRRRILQLVLQDAKLDPENFSMEYVSKITAGMSGSDIKEACRDAAMAPIREFMREHREKGRTMGAVDPSRFRGIRSEDFLKTQGGPIISDGHRRQPNKGSNRRSSDEWKDVDEPVVEEQD